MDWTIIFKKLGTLFVLGIQIRNQKRAASTTAAGPKVIKPAK